MELRLLRYSSGQESTLGLLFIDGVWQCYTLEDEYRAEKVSGETRIPAGRYRITLRTEGGLHSKYQSKFPDVRQGMLWIRDVPGFQHVLIHIGNRDDNTDGCVLVGDGTNNNQVDDGFVASSTSAYLRTYPKVAEALVAGEDVWITVEDTA